MLHASTIIARSSTQLIAHLSKLAASHNGQTLLFALSANAPDLSDLVSALTTYTSTSVGCLSAPLPAYADSGKYSCSIALFDSETTIPFRSTLAGRPPAQVGRWHAFRKGEDIPDKSVDMGLRSQVDWEDVWSRSTGERELPKGLEGLEPHSVHTILHFSDGSPEGLSHSLQYFENATKLGLLASGTPFVTGRPVTLLQNKNIYSDGAVGIALRSSTAPSLSSAFPGLKPITEQYTITRVDGNLVHELNESNPSRILLNAIASIGTRQEKEDDYYLGVFSHGDPTTMAQAYRITSGDPSRGTMALESDAAPEVGARVQLFHRPSGVPPILPNMDRVTKPELTFLSSSLDVTPAISGSSKDEAIIVQNCFVGASENGFLLGKGADASWRCTVPTAHTTLTF